MHGRLSALVFLVSVHFVLGYISSILTQKIGFSLPIAYSGGPFSSNLPSSDIVQQAENFVKSIESSINKHIDEVVKRDLRRSLDDCKAYWDIWNSSHDGEIFCHIISFLL